MKKKLACMALALLMVCCAVPALAENEDVFSQLENQTFEFSSGVGGWFTSLSMGRNGAFTGMFHDSEMGEMGEAYPCGSVYGCLFHGSFASPEQLGDTAWKLQVETLTMDEGQLPEVIEDGVRYVTSEPYGLSAAKEVILYLPGTPIESLPEGFLPWSHLHEIDPHAEKLPYYALWNAEEESGFITMPVEGELARQLGIANPWQQVDADALRQAMGVSFGLPEGVFFPEYYVLNGNELAEMQCYLDGARIIARARRIDAFTDISGLYFAWKSDEALNIQGCPGVCWSATEGEEDLRLCLWYDGTAGIMYSLYARDDDLSDVDLPALAEAVYAPGPADDAD